MSIPPNGTAFPPQLHLSIPPSTTSFKRSFEQFGFDLDDSPVHNTSAFGQSSSSSNGAGGSGPALAVATASSSGRDNSRNKRARSASSDTNSSGGSGSDYQSVSSSIPRLALEVPPRLPTPDVDVDMADINDPSNSATPSASITASTSLNFPEAYRLTLQRIHSPTSPPVLPPLRLSVDHEEDEPREELPGALHRDEPPRIHIDLPQAPLTIEEEESDESPAVIPPDPPTLPPIQTGDLFEPTTLPLSPSLHELRQWIDEAASPSAESSNSGLARSDVADPGMSRVILDVPSNSSPTNPDGERSGFPPGIPSPSRNRLRRSLGDFLSVAVEEDVDSPISTLFSERGEMASDSAFPWARHHLSAEARQRTHESPSAATSSYRPPSFTNFPTRRLTPFDEDDRDSVIPTFDSSVGTASRDAVSSTARMHNYGSSNVEGSQRSTLSSAQRRSSLGRAPTQSAWHSEFATMDNSSSDESETNLPNTTRPYHAPFTSRRALLAEQPSFLWGRSENTDSTAPPRQVRFRTSASSVIGESVSAMRTRELNRMGLGSSTTTSTSPATQRPSENQGIGFRTNTSTRVTNSLRRQSMTATQPSTLDDNASRMDFDRPTMQVDTSNPAFSARLPSPPPFSTAVSTFYPTALHDRSYHASNPTPDLRSAPRITARMMPSFPSLFDYDMALATDSDSSGESSPVFGPTSTGDQPPEGSISRTFVPPAIPSPNLDLSFGNEGHATQDSSNRTAPPRRASPAPRPDTTSITTDGWPPFPDFPFALDVFTNDLAHVPPSPSIEDPAPSLTSRYAPGSLPRVRHGSTTVPQGTASTAGHSASSTNRPRVVTYDDWPLELGRMQEESETSLRLSQMREEHSLRYLTLMRERDERTEREETWRRVMEPGQGTTRFDYPTPSFYGQPHPSATRLPSSSPSSGPTTSHLGPSTAPSGSGRTGGNDGAISSRFIPGPFSNTMRALERERNAVDASRNFRQQYGPPDPGTAPARPRNPPPQDPTAGSASTAHSHSHPHVHGGGSSSGGSGTVDPRLGTLHRYRVAAPTVESSDRSGYTQPQRSAEDVPPGVRRLQAMQSLRDRLVELQGMSSLNGTPRTGPPSAETRSATRHSMATSASPFSTTTTGSRREPANPFSASRRQSAPFHGGLLPPRTNPPSNTPTARPGLASYVEDTTEPFSQAIESLREPRQASTHASVEMTRRRARLEQLAEETRAANRDRSRVIRAEYVNRRRHTLNMRLGGFSTGDFVRDEEFDQSYEALLSLGSIVGEARPRGTPGSVLETMEKAKYEDWATPESDKRCPICLDDYTPMDQVMKLKNCSHWLHGECLEQWLKGASTCPVCRNQVHGSAPSAPSSSARRAYLAPMRYARATRLGLDRTPARDSTTTNVSNTQANSSSNSGNSNNNSGRNTDGSSNPTRAGPPPSSSTAFYRAFNRRDRDDDDTSGVGPSGSGSSSFSSSFGNMYTAF